MRGKGQLLVSYLLLFVLNVLAQNTGIHANSGSDSDDDDVRVRSSSLTSPSVSESSSGSVADSVQAARNVGLDTMVMQTKLSPLFAPPSSHAEFLIRADDLPLQAVFPPSADRVVKNPPLLSSSLLNDVGQEEDVDENSEQREKKRHYHVHCRNIGDPQPGQDVEDAPVFSSKRQASLFMEERRKKCHDASHTKKNGREIHVAPYFVGKRSEEESQDLEQEELQKRSIRGDNVASDFSELRLQPEALELDDEDATVMLDKRSSPLFVGKRRAPYFIGKRWAPYFVGKRPAPYFVGKRPAPYFVGKRPAPYFVGKRNNPKVSSRAAPMFVGRRRQAPLFVGRRHAPMFVGRRASAPMFIGKRGAPMFVGKRTSTDISELLSALHTLQAARHYRRMIQADKRHNAPFFVGRRSSSPAVAALSLEDKDNQPTTYESMEDDKESGSSWRDVSTDSANTLDKRFPEFVGKRAEEDSSTDKRYEFIGKRYEFIGKRNPYEFIGKRPYEFLGKRNFYEFLGKRSPYEFIGKRSPAYEFLGKRNMDEFLGKRNYEFLGKRNYEFLGKRNYEFLGKRNKGVDHNMPSSPTKRTLIDFYGKRVELPYEFVGKRSIGGAWERAGEKNLLEDSRRTKTSQNTRPSLSLLEADDTSSRFKRYTEWLGKRGAQPARQLPQDVNKHMSTLLLRYLPDGASPSFVGHSRRGLRKRYTEFVGK